ncbi:MAG TPA: hypothetical protein DCQ90_06555 [Erysipelotrichaceae bacterium]|nr:hypothetical protein [Erysipelotrichaceae bacterium]
MLSKITVIAETTEGAIKVIQEMKKVHPEITTIEVRITKESVVMNDAKSEFDYEKLEKEISNVFLGILEGLIDFRIRKAIG